MVVLILAIVKPLTQITAALARLLRSRLRSKQGDAVRKLKAAKAPADEIKAAVDKLLELKAKLPKKADDKKKKKKDKKKGKKVKKDKPKWNPAGTRQKEESEEGDQAEDQVREPHPEGC